MMTGDEKVVVSICLVTETNLPHFAGIEVQLFNGYDPTNGDKLVPLEAYADLAAELASEREKSGKFFGIAYDTQTKLDAAESQLAELRGKLEGLAGSIESWHWDIGDVKKAKQFATDLRKLAAADGGG